MNILYFPIQTLEEKPCEIAVKKTAGGKEKDNNRESHHIYFIIRMTLTFIDERIVWARKHTHTHITKSKLIPAFLRVYRIKGSTRTLNRM